MTVNSDLKRIREEIEILEIQIDEAVWGRTLPREDGVRPSMFNYWPEIYQEEIALDPSLSERLAEAERIKARIRELENEANALEEQINYEKEQGSK